MEQDKYYEQGGDGYKLSDLLGSDSRVQNLIDAVRSNTTRGGRVLDLGCGDMSLATLAPEYSWTGIDICTKDRPSIINHNLSETPYPLEAKSFDTVVCSEVLEHLWEPTRVLSEIHRLLKPGGIAVVTVPNMDNLDNVLSGYKPLLYNPDNSHTVEHIRLYNTPVMIHLMKQSGLNVFYTTGNSPQMSFSLCTARTTLTKALKETHTQIQVDQILGQMFPGNCPGMLLVARAY